MLFTLVLNFESQGAAQAWLEDTFDLSAVQIESITPSPFRSQVVASVRLVDATMKKVFGSGLDRLRNVYPESERKVLWWDQEVG